MSQRAEASFAITGWDEKPYDEMEGGPKLTRAHVTKAFTGDLEGVSTVEFLMMHRAEGGSSFIGYERVDGTLCGKAGSFVLRHEGTFVEGTVRGSWNVVEGSGTADLQGLAGTGDSELAHAERYPWALDFEL